MSETFISDKEYIAMQFQIKGKIKLIRNIGNGYINRTYLVEAYTDDGKRHRYTLQRVNTNVFRDMDALMNNFVFITEHLHEKFLLEGHHHKKGSIPTVVRTLDGKDYLRTDGGCWRMMTHFSHVYTMDIPENPEVFYLCGKSFGRFICDVSDIDPEKINITIPNFHNTYSRYLDLEKAIENDFVERVKEVGPEIEFIRKHIPIMKLISSALDEGRIPTRITHNDTNLNNILFHKDTNMPVAVVDLDTVMPSSLLYDYGDSLRIGTNTACDDERDLSRVSCNLELYESYTRGFLESCGEIMTKEEFELLPFASRIITLEDGIRFLADYINGDIYYIIHREKQNLDRARTQLKLVEDMEAKASEIEQIILNIRKDLNLL